MHGVLLHHQLFRAWFFCLYKDIMDIENIMWRFIFIVHNGDLSKVAKIFTRIIWYEEWVLFFEIMWGQTVKRWEYLDQLYSKYQTREICDAKMQEVLTCSQIWPLFALYFEDQVIQSKTWR
jgi:hypothetical protein